ncbi:MAG: glycosyltransferase family 39 protein, partial [Pirellulaceae bacterium]|nr:glycosyltransferase family 39 protein [Pirellulaceae bacterium]
MLLVLSVSLRVAAPSDLFDNDQSVPIAHVVDVAANGNWLMQRDPAGRLATKPPMYPWLGALAVRITGRTDEWTFKLPVVLAFGVVAALVFDLARHTMDARTAALATAFWAANFQVFKLMFTARTDMVLTMWIVVGLWSVQRQRPRWHSRGVGQFDTGRWGQRTLILL